MSAWVRLASGSSTGLLEAGECSGGIDPNGWPEYGEHHPAAEITFSSSGVSCLFRSMYPDTQYAGGDNSVQMHTINATFTAQQWHHILVGDSLGGISDRNYENTQITRGKIIWVMIDGVVRSGIENGFDSSLRAVVTDGTYYGEPNLYEYVLPGLTLNTLAKPAYFPSQFGNYGSVVDFADVQIWFGTFINPNVAGVLSNFVNIANGRGTPQDVSIAARSFGAPSILVRGDRTSFGTNRGTGGAFVLTGSPHDFTPAPSY